MGQRLLVDVEMEKDLLFRSHWQLVCHVNDLPEPGDFVTMDCVGERALVIRGKDGVLRGFHNLWWTQRKLEIWRRGEAA